MTPERIDELRALCEAAPSVDELREYMPRTFSAQEVTSAAAARAALPEALDEIERLHADLDAMRTEMIEAKRERNAALDRAASLLVHSVED